MTSELETVFDSRLDMMETIDFSVHKKELGHVQCF